MAASAWRWRFYGAMVAVTACSRTGFERLVPVVETRGDTISAGDTGDVGDSPSSCPTLYLDRDGDGLGDGSTAIDSCSPIENRVENGDDCDDSSARFTTSSSGAGQCLFVPQNLLGAIVFPTGVEDILWDDAVESHRINSDTGEITVGQGATIRPAGEGLISGIEFQIHVADTPGAPDIGVFAVASLRLETVLRASGNNALLLWAATTVDIVGVLQATGEGQSAGPGGAEGGASQQAGRGNGAGVAGPDPLFFSICADNGGSGAGFGTGGGAGGLEDQEACADQAVGGAPYGLACAGPLWGGSGGGGGSQAGGAGGGGGGAIQISAGSSINISETGMVNVGGGGGLGSLTGGGGGGSGGSIWLEAPVVTMNGVLVSNGGGGGGGGAGSGSGISGGPGSPGGETGENAAGGWGSGSSQGAPGGALSLESGQEGSTGDSGGGGGGGVGRLCIANRSGTNDGSPGLMSPSVQAIVVF